MPIAATSLLASGNSGDATSYLTSSRTPTTDYLQLFGVANLRSAGAAPTPTVTGCSLTWVEIATTTHSGDAYQVTLFRALGTPAAGALTIDCGGSTQNGCSWVWAEFSGIDTSGTNGSGAIVQSATASSGAGTPSATLAAFGGAANATFGFFGGRDNAGSWTVGSGFTSLGAPAGNYPRSLAEFRTDNDTSVDATYSSGGNVVAIAVEIKAAPVSGTTTVIRRRLTRGG